MSTLMFLTGFAVVLFLPCAVALLGVRDVNGSSAYSDRTVDPTLQARLVTPLQPAAKPSADLSVAENGPAAPSHWPAPLEIADPVLPNRVQRTYQARILRNEIEALMAAAAAARAHADALAANARLSAAKAEAADAAATAAEDDAAAAIQEMRRAA